MDKEVLSSLIALARAAEGNEWNLTAETRSLISEAVNDDGVNTQSLIKRIEDERKRLVPDCFCCAEPCGRTAPYDLENLNDADPDVKAAKQRLIENLKASDSKGDDSIYRLLYAIGRDDWSAEDLRALMD